MFSAPHLVRWGGMEVHLGRRLGMKTDRINKSKNEQYPVVSVLGLPLPSPLADPVQMIMNRVACDGLMMKRLTAPVSC